MVKPSVVKTRYNKKALQTHSLQRFYFVLKPQKNRLFAPLLKPYCGERGL